MPSLAFSFCQICIPCSLKVRTVIQSNLFVQTTTCVHEKGTHGLGRGESYCCVTVQRLPSFSAGFSNFLAVRCCMLYGPQNWGLHTVNCAPPALPLTMWAGQHPCHTAQTTQLPASPSHMHYMGCPAPISPHPMCIAWLPRLFLSC